MMLKTNVGLGCLAALLAACSGEGGEPEVQVRSLSEASSVSPDCGEALAEARADVSAAADLVALAEQDLAVAKAELESAATPAAIAVARQHVAAAHQAIGTSKSAFRDAQQVLSELRQTCSAASCTPSFAGLGSGAFILRADGTVVSGPSDVSDDGSIGVTASSVWMPSGSVPLTSYLTGIPAAAESISAAGLSADGSVIVGSVVLPKPPYWSTPQLYRWSAAAGFEVIPQAGEDWEYGVIYTVGVDVSADGVTLLGYTYSLPDPSYAYRYWYPFLWTSAAGYEFIGRPDGFQTMRPSALSRDASSVVGLGQIDAVYSSEYYALIWRRSTGWLNLGLGALNAVSGDGGVAVGNQIEPSTLAERASVWDLANGLRLVTDVLDGAGVTTSGWTLLDATSVSADGKLVLGTGTNPSGLSEAWLACLPSSQGSPPTAARQ